MKIILILLLIPFAANAYIDPSSGSAILSAIIGAFVAVGIAIKTYWYKLKSLFTGKKTPTDTEED
jgi:hypothetical protein